VTAAAREAELHAFFARAARRLSWLAALRGAAIGLALALAPALAFMAVQTSAGAGAVVVAVAGLIAGAVVAARRMGSVAQRIERHAPQCRNLLITAAELHAVSGHSAGSVSRLAVTRPGMAALISRDALSVARGIDLAELFPARRALGAMVGAAALWVLAALLPFARSASMAAASSSAGVTAASIDAVDVTITPPSYTGQPPREERDPTRIEALAGSRIRIAARGSAASVRLETMAGAAGLEAAGAGGFTGEVVADADGYVALEPVAADGNAGPRRLIGLTVIADRLPRVSLTEPGRDLYVADANRTIEIAVTADDDLGLGSLRLHYTKVSGSGEQFTFTEGDVPLAITRTRDSEWTGRGTLRLNTLGLVPGDMVVYRGIATDRRPGAQAAESDAFIIEITAPGSIAAEGFAMDDEQDRYALSQQMVILQTERLLARAAGMHADSLAQEALRLSAEQRSVRAEFVFMMGGELAEDIVEGGNIGDLNEADHVEADDEAIAGRLANRGRLNLMQAIRAMSRATAALNEASLDTALVEEKAALASLQRAFSRTRYILRALTQRERLDLERRLTGVLSDARGDVRPAAETEPAQRVVALRRALAEVGAIAAVQPDAAGVTGIAQEVLRIDPADPSLHEIAGWLTDAATALREGRSAEARGLLERAVAGLADAVRSDVVDAPAARGFELYRLDGALTEALRQRGGSR
jgi:hypothetical protein